jgi:hypothetical protein
MAFLRRKVDYGKHLACPVWILPKQADGGPHAYRACYLGTAVYVCGFVILGAAFQMHLSIWILVVGWAISVVGTMVATVAICAFLEPHLTHED